jgi:hypothetical protein
MCLMCLMCIYIVWSLTLVKSSFFSSELSWNCNSSRTRLAKRSNVSLQQFVQFSSSAFASVSLPTIGGVQIIFQKFKLHTSHRFPANQHINFVSFQFNIRFNFNNWKKREIYISQSIVMNDFDVRNTYIRWSGVNSGLMSVARILGTLTFWGDCLNSLHNAFK